MAAFSGVHHAGFEGQGWSGGWIGFNRVRFCEVSVPSKK